MVRTALAPSIVKMAKPAHFVATFGKGRLAIETPGEVAEDREIVARAVHRLDRLFHGNDKAVARRTADIVALERGGGWQHDIGIARRCRPPWLVHDDGFRSTPRATQPVKILMMMKRIAAGPINQMDIGIGALPSVEIIGSTWMQQAIGDARRWDRTRQRIIENPMTGARKAKGGSAMPPEEP